MKPTIFPEQTVVLGEDQPQYLPLPAAVINTHEPVNCTMCKGTKLGKAISGILTVCPACGGTGSEPIWKRFVFKYELTDLDIEQIIKTRGFFFVQEGFGFNPVSPQITSPFRVWDILYKVLPDGSYDLWAGLDNGEMLELSQVPLSEIVDALCSRVGNMQPENLQFIEKECL